MPMMIDNGGGGSVASQIWTFLTGKGLSPGAAAGVMGNLAQESSLDPTAAGGGLAQWIGSRQQGLDAYAASQHESPQSIDAQMNYLWIEMQSGQYGSADALNGMSPGNAAVYFEQNFERAGVPMMQNRINYANTYYQEFAQGGSGDGAPQGGPGGGAFSVSPTITNGAAGFFQGIDNSMQFHGFDVTHPISFVTGNGEALGLRALFFILGLLLLIFGLYQAVQRG